MLFFHRGVKCSTEFREISGQVTRTKKTKTKQHRAYLIKVVGRKNQYQGKKPQLWTQRYAWPVTVITLHNPNTELEIEFFHQGFPILLEEIVLVKTNG